jgi:hypothetical protein
MKTGKTVEQLAAAAHAHPEPMLELLRDECRRGILVELQDGTFALSVYAESTYGDALRDLNSWKE